LHLKYSENRQSVDSEPQSEPARRAVQVYTHTFVGVKWPTRRRRKSDGIRTALLRMTRFDLAYAFLIIIETCGSFGVEIPKSSPPHKKKMPS